MEEPPIPRARVPRPDALSFTVRPESRLPKTSSPEKTIDTKFKRLTSKIHKMKPSKRGSGTRHAKPS